MTRKMKTANAHTYIEVMVKCPYCKDFFDILGLDTVRENLGNDHSAENCNIEIKCEECEGTFLVENINY